MQILPSTGSLTGSSGGAGPVNQLPMAPPLVSLVPYFPPTQIRGGARWPITCGPACRPAGPDCDHPDQGDWLDPTHAQRPLVYNNEI